MIGALWARENLISHSRWMAFSTSSCTSYSWVLPFMTHCTLRTLWLCGSLTILFITYHILLLSSRLIVCLMAAVYFSVSSPRNLWGNPKGVPSLAPWLVSLGLLFKSSHTAVRPVIPPLLVLLDYWYAGIVQIIECSLCCLFSLPSFLWAEGKHEFCHTTFEWWGWYPCVAIEFFCSSFLHGFLFPSSVCRALLSSNATTVETDTRSILSCCLPHSFALWCGGCGTALVLFCCTFWKRIPGKLQVYGWPAGRPCTCIPPREIRWIHLVQRIGDHLGFLRRWALQGWQFQPPGSCIRRQLGFCPSGACTVC